MRINRTFLIVFHDIFMAGLAYIFALFLRLGDDVLLDPKHVVVGTSAILLVNTFILPFSGLHKTLWRYTSLNDILRILKMSILITLAFLVGMFLFNRLEGVPRTVFLINLIIYNCFLSGPRVIYRILKEKNFNFQNFKIDYSKKISVLLVGLTPNSELFIRKMADPDSEYRIVGIVDQNQKRHSAYIHNIKIYGGLDMIERTFTKLTKKGLEPRKMVIGADYDGKTIRELLKLSDVLGLSLARIPTITDLVAANREKLALKPIVIEDLLGRAQKRLDLDSMKKMIEGKSILVTGGGGTIGSELVRQVCDLSPSNITIVELSEFNLYSIEQELQIKFPQIRNKCLLVDINNKKALEKVIANEKPEIIFHAAALKHVPIVEVSPVEAIETNIFGTKNLGDLAVKYKVKMMVLISTDKAVNPSNIMGATKRIAEHYLHALANSEENIMTDFVTVRFGNVLGSSGSVITLFEKQLKAGGPLTITHPDMVRYFMTVREAVLLVIQAAALSNKDKSKHSFIYVLDMGEPVRILDLAQQMIKMTGLVPNQDIRIEFTGLRPGEKLFEELFYPKENPEKTEIDDINLAKPAALDYKDINERFKKLKTISEDYIENIDQIKSILCEVLPEYNPNGN